MIELGDELDVALRVKQSGTASRSLLNAYPRAAPTTGCRTWSTSAARSCLRILGLRHHPGLAVDGGLASLFGVFVFTPGGVLDPSLAAAQSAEHSCFRRTRRITCIRSKPSAFLFPASFLVLMPIWLLLVDVLRIPGASFFLCGFSAAYFYYGALHHFEHTTRINQIPVPVAAGTMGRT